MPKLDLPHRAPTAAPMHVACIGETMAMVTSAIPEPLRSAERFTITPGGAETNVASYLVACGFTASWVSALGDDVLGHRLATMLRDRGIDLSRVHWASDAPTGVYFKDPMPTDQRSVYYYRKGSAASRLGKADAGQVDLNGVDWMHTTGITAAISNSSYEFMHALLDRAPRERFGVSYDVNYRPALLSKAEAAARNIELGRRSDIVFVGLDEAQEIWGVETPEEVAELFPETPLVVVKDSHRDATELRRTEDPTAPVEVTRAPALSVEVIDAVGAGDAFAAGYLAAYFRGVSPERCLAAGHLFASRAIRALSDFAPIPPEDLDALLEGEIS